MCKIIIYYVLICNYDNSYKLTKQCLKRFKLNKNETLGKMEEKDILLDNIKKFLDKSRDDVAETYEEMYKTKVAVNTILLLLIKKVIFTEKEFKEEMKKVRKRVREE